MTKWPWRDMTAGAIFKFVSILKTAGSHWGFLDGGDRFGYIRWLKIGPDQSGTQA